MIGKSIALALMLVSTSAMAVSDIAIHRDPRCGCCDKWAAQVVQKFGRQIQVVNTTDRTALHNRLGMLAKLASCHTAIIDGIAFEGHVPIADMIRVLAKKPTGVRGLAVAGMPLGSPGMEVPGYPADRYEVIAFGSGKKTVYAQY